MADYGSYPRVTRILHWAMAALIVVGFALGLRAESLAQGVPVRNQIMFFHKSIGLAVLGLAVVRLAWTRRRPGPALPAHMPAFEHALARSVHGLLYVLLFAGPLSGLLLSQAAGRPVSVFGLFDLPQILHNDPATPVPQRAFFIAGSIAHKTVFVFALSAAVGLHVVGALKHLVIERDVAMFRRMWG